MKEAVVRKWNATVRRSDLGDRVETDPTRVLKKARVIEGFRNVTFLAEGDADPGADFHGVILQEARA